MAPEAMVFIDLYVFCLKICFFQELTSNNAVLRMAWVLGLPKYTDIYGIKQSHIARAIYMALGVMTWTDLCHSYQKCDFWIIRYEYGKLFSPKKARTFYIMHL
jgi:hypothetical protein